MLIKKKNNNEGVKKNVMDESIPLDQWAFVKKNLPQIIYNIENLY